MITQEIFTLAISAPILVAIFWAIYGLTNKPKKVPVRVRKNHKR